MCQVGLPNKGGQTGLGETENRSWPATRTKKEWPLQRTATLVASSWLNCLTLQEAPCNAKRANAKAEQHDGRAAIRNGVCNCPKHESRTELIDC